MFHGLAVAAAAAAAPIASNHTGGEQRASWSGGTKASPGASLPSLLVRYGPFGPP